MLISSLYIAIEGWFKKIHRNETNCQWKESLPSTLSGLKKLPFLSILLCEVVRNLWTVPIPAGNSPLTVNCFTAGPAVTSALCCHYHIGAPLKLGNCQQEIPGIYHQQSSYQTDWSKAILKFHYKNFLWFSQIWSTLRVVHLFFFFHLNRLSFYLAVRIENIKKVSKTFLFIFENII